MSKIPKGRIRAFIDHDGVARLIHPTQPHPYQAVLDGIMSMAAASNRLYPALEECTNAKYASFVQQHYMMWLCGPQGLVS